jgi:hypothetical protein
MRVGTPPPAGRAGASKQARTVGVFGMIVGFSIIIGTWTGLFKAAGNSSLGYMVGGVTVAYALLRFLRGTTDRRS